MRLRLLESIRRSRRRQDAAGDLDGEQRGGEPPGHTAASVGAHRKVGRAWIRLPRTGGGRPVPQRADAPRSGGEPVPPQTGIGRPGPPWADSDPPPLTGGKPGDIWAGGRPRLGGAQPGSARGGGPGSARGGGPGSARGGGQPGSSAAGGPPGSPRGGAQPFPPQAGRGQPGNGAGPQAPAVGSPGQAPGRGGQPASHALPRRWGIARAATRTAPRAAAASDPPASVRSGRPAQQAANAKVPWYEIAQSNRTVAGRRHCGALEPIVHREWAENVVPPPEVVRAIDRLADLPQIIKAKLATGLDAIYVGMGGVPSLDDMGQLKGVSLPSGRATWDACAGAYGERKIIVGSRPSPSPDVTCHEIGHALDDIDGTGDQWQSDSEEFNHLYDQCLPHMVSAFHRQPGLLGRREFFADAFAAIASRQRPALVEMLGGDTRSALNVMLYFNVRYGI
jgi:hypothetical protein